jgi:uncharacterized coiled-coil protein SlyX
VRREGGVLTMTFQPTTIKTLRDKLAQLESQREQHQVDLNYHADHVAKIQVKLDEHNAAIEDYTSLLEYADRDDKAEDSFDPATIDQYYDPAPQFGGLGSAWSDPAVRRAVSETIAESEAGR